MPDTFGLSGLSAQDILGGDFSTFLQGQLGRNQDFSGNVANAMMNPVFSLGNQLGQAADTSLPLGLASLANIFASQGQTDPRQANMIRGDIARGTQQNQDAFRGNLAQAGLTGSGVGQAIGASIGQGGVQDRARFDANEAAPAEQRKRQDINAFLPMLISALQGNVGGGFQQFNTVNSQRDQNRQFGQQMGLSGLGALLGGFCWVARAVYKDARWLKVRWWMLNMAPDRLRRLYGLRGPGLALAIRSRPELGESLRHEFDWILSQVPEGLEA